MTNLLTKGQMLDYLPLAANLDETRINMLATEQEKPRCIKFLGRELYAALLAGLDVYPSDAKWTDLHNAIIPMLAYWTYAAYLEKGKIFNTATGPVIKRTDSSFQLSDDEVKRAFNSTCEMARFYESELSYFLETNKDLYDEYRAGAKHTGHAVFSLKKTIRYE